jgi:hypothetical protein
VAIDALGNLYIADYYNNAIRKITNSYLSPITGAFTVCAGSTSLLSDTASGGTWNSSNTAIATINSAGLVTGVSTGSALISYTAPSSCGYSISTAVVSVITTTSAGDITGPSSICLGSPVTLSDSVSGGTWSSSSTRIATVSGGLVTGIRSGSAVITYTLTGSCGSAFATTTVYIRNNVSAEAFNNICTGISSSTPLIAIILGGGISTYTWTPSTDLSATTGSYVIASPTVTSTYTVTCVSSYGCISSATARVNVYPVTPVPTGITTICMGATELQVL